MDENKQAKELEALMRKTKEVFRSESEPYKQKLVFNLLNAIKANDQKEFFWVLLKTINAKIKDNKDAKELSEKLEFMNQVYNIPNDFEKMAFSIVMGIMSSQ